MSATLDPGPVFALAERGLTAAEATERLRTMAGGLHRTKCIPNPILGRVMRSAGVEPGHRNNHRSKTHR